MHRKNFPAITLFEVILVMGLMALIAAILIPISSQSLSRTNINSESEKLASSIWRVMQYAYTGKNASSHGISFQSNGYTIYEGASQASSTEQSFEQFPEGINISSISFGSGGNELSFNQNTIFPNTTGYVIITDGITSNRIEINSEGFINYFRL